MHRTMALREWAGAPTVRPLSVDGQAIPTVALRRPLRHGRKSTLGAGLSDEASHRR